MQSFESLSQKKFVVPPLYPKQLQFCQSKVKYTLYGGARGGGKSFIARIKAVQLALLFDGIQILFLRRTLPDLKKNHLLTFKELLEGIAKFNQTDNLWTFPNGSIIQFGYCDAEADVLHYQGQQYEAIFLDEATQFTFYQFNWLIQCLRPSGLIKLREGQTLPKPRMYLTANPGNVGHMWVKRLFIDRRYLENEQADEFAFIPALVYDNEFIMQNDPDYVKVLESLPENQRKAMLEGDWNTFEGQFFEEFDENIHTFDPNNVDGTGRKFEIESNWNIVRGRDYGLDMLACYFCAIDENDTLWIYKRVRGPNYKVSESGTMINQATTKQEKEQMILDLCPPDMWNRQSQTGKSAVDILQQECEQYVTKANNDRVIGWLMVKELMKVSDITGKPRLRISKDCIELIESLKMIQHDEKNVNDCAKNPHDLTHDPDALRYIATSYTYPADPRLITTRSKDFSYAEFALNMGDYEVNQDEDDMYMDYIDREWIL